MGGARQAIVLHDDDCVRDDVGSALGMAGFEVRSTACLEEAGGWARAGVDALLAGERVGGRLTHGLLLLAEWRNPLISCLLLAEGVPDPELLDLLPSLRAVLPAGTAPAILARILAAPAVESAGSRLARLWDAADAPDLAVPSGVPMHRAGPPPGQLALPAFLARRGRIHDSPACGAGRRPHLRLVPSADRPAGLGRRAACIRRLHSR